MGTATESHIISNDHEFCYCPFYFTTTPLTKGEKYTVSFNAKFDDGDNLDIVTVMIYNTQINGREDDNNDSSYAKIINGRVTKTLTITGDDASTLLIYAGIAGNTSGHSLTISNLKFERGTIATDWTPAPEDFTKEIEALKTRITALESKE